MVNATDWLTTRQAAEAVQGAVTAQYVKLAANREAKRGSKFVAKVGRDWLVDPAWPLLAQWREKGERERRAREQGEELEILRGDVEALRSRIAADEESRGQLEEDYAAMKSERDALRAQNERLRAEVAQARAERDGTSARVAELEKAALSMTQSNAELAARCEALNKELEAARAQADEIRAKNGAQAAEARPSRSKIGDEELLSLVAAYVAEHPEATMTETAKAVSMARSTLSSRLKKAGVTLDRFRS